MTVGSMKYPSPASAPSAASYQASFFLAHARCIRESIFIEPSLMTGPMFALSAGSPTVIFSTRDSAFRGTCRRHAHR